MNLLDSAGAIVDRQCGLHVHWGVGDWDLTKFKNLYKWYAKFEQAIDSIVSPSRRGNRSQWATGYSGNAVIDHSSITHFFNMLDGARDIYQLRRFVGSIGSGYARYRKLNMEAFWGHSTIEFRQHQGTLSADKAEHWIRLTGGMIQSVDNGMSQRKWTEAGDQSEYTVQYKLGYMMERLLRAKFIPASTSRFLKKRQIALAS